MVRICVSYFAVFGSFFRVCFCLLCSVAPKRILQFTGLVQFDGCVLKSPRFFRLFSASVFRFRFRFRFVVVGQDVGAFRDARQQPIGRDPRYDSRWRRFSVRLRFKLCWFSHQCSAFHSQLRVGSCDNRSGEDSPDSLVSGRSRQILYNGSLVEMCWREFVEQ